MLLVKKTNSWANMPPLSEKDLAQRAMDWQDELEAEIPLDRLPDALSRARQNHSSSFPINLYEISTAYRELKAEESAEAAKLQAEGKERDPIAFCDEVKNHRTKDGDVVIFSLFTKTDELVPCRSCRPSEYERWRKVSAGMYGEHKPLTVLQNFKKTEYVNLCDPLEILNRAKDEIAREMVSKVGTEEYDNVRAVWMSVLNAIKYVRESEAAETRIEAAHVQGER